MPEAADTETYVIIRLEAERPDRHYTVLLNQKFASVISHAVRQKTSFTFTSHGGTEYAFTGGYIVHCRGRAADKNDMDRYNSGWHVSI